MPERKTSGKTKKRRDLAEKIRQFIEDELRSAIREDGGDIGFESLEGSTVKITMGASCCGCPAATRTSKHFVEKKLREKFANDLRVEVRFVKPYYAV